MEISENKVLEAIKRNSPFFKCFLFRNNVGMFKIREKGKKDRNIKTGLGKGSSDLIGYTIKNITPDMVGKNIAVFTAIEVKKSNWKANKKLNEHELNQKRFIDQIKEAGGIADFATSIDDLNNLMSKSHE